MNRSLLTSHRRLLCLFATGALAVSRLSAASGAIAMANGQEFPPEKIQAYLETLSPNDRAALEKDPALLSQAVRALILQQVLFKEALAAGWDKKPEVIERLERVRQGVVVESYLQTVTKLPEGFPDDAEVKKAFDSKKELLVLPQQFQLAQIFVASGGSDPASLAKSKERAEEISRKAHQSGADFAALAKSESDEPETAARGGEIGWLTEASLQPEIRSQVRTLAKNAVSEPVQLGDGWYVLKMLDIKSSRPATLEEVRPELVRLLRAERTRLNRETYLAKLQQQTPMALNELALTQLLKPTQP